MKSLLRFSCLSLLVLSFSTAAESEKPATDPATGMVVAEGWEFTRNSCIVCHSANQFLRQRGSRSTWTEILVWMQKYQGMLQLPAESETTILDYLSANYGPEDGRWRRAPIPATLMPVNPYVSEARKEFEALQKEKEKP
jgi:hypothetical protein